MVVGFLLPVLIARVSTALAEQTDNLALVVGISGLALHAMLEGMALMTSWTLQVDAVFATTLILHRIPVSLVIWWLIRPRFGSLAATTGVGSIVLATLAGYGLGTEFLAGIHGSGAEIYQAFVSGSLVHVVFHQGRHDYAHSNNGPHYHQG